MRELILANLGINFKFYGRSRLLLVASALVLLMTALSMLPSLFALTSAQHLELITSITQNLSGFSVLLGIGLVVLHVSHHLQNRSVKMIVTKPCPPDAWLFASAFSAALVVSGVYLALLLIGSAMFIAWGIPYQTGLVFVVVNDLAHALVWMSYAMVLAVLVRPVVAILTMLLFQEDMFYWLKLLLASAAKSEDTGYAAAIRLLRMLVDAVYFVLPLTSPFADQNAQVYKSLRGSDANWWTLASTWGYALGAWLFCFLLASHLLKRKRLI